MYEVLSSMPGREPEDEDIEDERMLDPANPLVGERQKYWDFPRSVDFTMGGMSTGLVIMATIAHFFSGLSTEALLYLNAATGGSMAVGCSSCLWKSGAKTFLRVLLRPQSSWMTRETYAVAVFYPALLADLIWPNPALHLLVALAALIFLYCQARILHAAKGIPAWRVDLIPTMLVMTGLLEGVVLGVVSGLASWRFEASMMFISFWGALLALLNALIWQRYLPVRNATACRRWLALSWSGSRRYCDNRASDAADFIRHRHGVQRISACHRQRCNGRRRCDVEIHYNRLRQLSAGLCDAEDAPARLRHTGGTG